MRKCVFEVTEKCIKN